MPNDPAVSIVIPCYNSVPYLEETLRSAAAQTLPSVEIILVDDGSQDGTRDLILSLIEGCPNRRIRTIFQQNAGLASARNVGIAAARGRYVLPLDSDDLIAPGMAERCASLLDAEAEIAVVYGDCEQFGQVEAVWRAGRFELGRLKYFNQLAYCAVYRKAMWQAVGGYRPNVTGFDDWDFWIATAGLGYVGRYMPEVFLKHRRRAGSQMSSIIGDYDRLYASIILNNQEHYAAPEIQAARTLLAGGPAAPIFGSTRFIFLNHFRGKLQPRNRWRAVPCGY